MVKGKIKFFTLFLILILLISGCSPKDTSPPQVSITYPQNGQTVSGVVTIEVQANDNVGVTKVEFYVDNAKVGEDATSPYEYSWNTDTLQYNSQHTIKAKAYDNAGNVGESSIVTVTIGDTQAPQVTITNPQNGATVSGEVLIQVSVVEKSSGKKIAKAPSGIQKVEFYIDGVMVGEDTTSPYEYSWNTDTLQYNSQHTIKAKAYDSAGNVGESPVVTVTIGDTQAPQVIITSLPNEAIISGVVLIQADVVEKSPGKKIAKAPSGLNKVEFYIDGDKVREDISSPYKYEWDTTKYSDGAHIIMVKAYDNVGNNSSTSITVNVNNTSPSNVWQKTFGGSDNDYAHSIQQTSDGGYIVAGETLSFVTGGCQYDVYILKLDADGNLVWQKTFGGSHWDVAYSIQQTSDGGYIVAGYTFSFGDGSYPDVYIIKLDSDGNLVWQKTFGGSHWDEARSIQQTSDGGYIVAGETYSFGAGCTDVYILKLDANGNLVWQKTFGGSNWDEANSIQQTSDGGYIVAGTKDIDPENFESGDIYILKLDVDGNLIWQKTFGGIYPDWAYSIQQTSDGGYIVAGTSILKLDANGNLVWQKTFNGGFHSIQQTSDGGYIVAGETLSFVTGGYQYDVYILKLDENGNLVWEKTYGGSGRDIANSIQQTSDGGYIIAGYTKSFGAGGSDVYVIKLDANGNTGPYPQ